MKKIVPFQPENPENPEKKKRRHERQPSARVEVKPAPETQGLDSLSFPAWLRISAQRWHGLLSARGKTIEDAARHYLEFLDRTEKSVPLGELVKLCIAAKKNACLSKEWLGVLKLRLKTFCNAIGEKTPVSEITSPQIVDFLATQKCSPATQNSVRAVLWALFAFAETTGRVSKNPVRGTVRAKEIAAPVGILTPAQLAALLDAAAPQWLPFLAIGAFAGLRSAELKRLDWAQVDLVDGFIEVTAKNAKSARRRLVKILPALDAYIRPFAKTHGRVCPCKKFIPSDHIPETIKAAGIEVWPRNALRHSFASFHIAHFRDAAGLALELGHTTTSLIFQHYRQVVKQSDGERWWTLRPSAESLAAKVIAITSAAPAAAQAQ